MPTDADTRLLAEAQALALQSEIELLRVQNNLLKEQLKLVDPLFGTINVVLKYASLAEAELTPTVNSARLFGSIDSLRLIVSLYPKPEHNSGS